MGADEILFEYIKSDMQRIDYYGLYILSVSTFIIVAAFSFSAYVFSKGCAWSRECRFLLPAVNAVLLIVALLIANSTFNAIDFSNRSKELREAALCKYLFRGRKINQRSLLPRWDCRHSMTLNQQKLPLKVVILILIFKLFAKYTWQIVLPYAK